MSNSIIRYALPVVALGLSGLGVYQVGHQSIAVPPAAPYESPARNPYDSAVAATGIVEAETENISIGSALTGLVLDVYVPSNKAGTLVTAGTPLFHIDDRHLKAQLHSAEAQLSMAESKLAKLKQQPRPEELPPSLAK